MSHLTIPADMLSTNPALIAEGLPPLQEAAVLFSAGHAGGAKALVEAHLATPRGRGDASAESMLVELAKGAAPTTPLEAPGTFALRGVLSASHPGLKPLAAHAHARRAFIIDMGGVERIDFAFAGDFTALLRGFHAGGRRVIMVNCRQLELGLLEAMGAGRYVSFLRRPVSPMELAAA